jgi:signal transduction histidine kinase
MRLAPFIRANGAQIIGEWEDFARTLEPGESMSPRGLRDHAADILAFIAGDIESYQTKSEQMEKSHGGKDKTSGDSAAEIHAALRLADGFSMEEMVAEYRALRASVIKLWYAQLTDATIVDTADLIRFVESIDQTLTESICHYTRLRAAELRSTREQLEKSREHLEQVAYITSHDLKEPLRGLSYHASVLLEDYGDKLDESGVKRLMRLSSIPKKMDEMIDGLYKYARCGDEGLTFEKTDLNLVIKEIEEYLELLLHEANAKIIVEHELPSIICDKTSVARIFDNLIKNAVKYNESDQPIIRVGQRDDIVEANAGELVFYVRDNGIGIDPSHHGEIFRLFKRLNPEDPHRKGTGMGLALVRRLVERHGGRIWLESVVGEGTTFYFTLGQSQVRAAA